MWYHRKIGGGRCPIVDTWWQTETGGIMMSPLPGAIRHQAGKLHQAAAGHRAGDRRFDDGKPVPAGPRRLAGHHQALARHAARHLGRRRSAIKRTVLEQGAAHAIWPATTPARTPTATTGSWAASTTC